MTTTLLAMTCGFAAGTFLAVCLVGGRVVGILDNIQHDIRRMRERGSVL